MNTVTITIPKNKLLAYGEMLHIQCTIQFIWNALYQLLPVKSVLD